MALINTLDPADVGERLTRWLPTALPGATDVLLSDIHIPASNGMSSQSVLLEARWTLGGVEHAGGLVVRVAPASAGLFPSYDLAREARVMNAVAAGTDAPAPRVIGIEATGEVLGGPFVVMERAYGLVPSDDPPYTVQGWVAELDDAGRARLYDGAIGALASLARTNVEELGLEELALAHLGATPTDQLLAHWHDFYDWARDGRTSPTIDAAWTWLQEHRPAAENPPVLSWGDARLGNLMFGPTQEVTAVLDWELAQVGPPEFDLGFLLFTTRTWTDGLGVPVPSGFPDRADTVARFEELSGVRVGDIDWWEAFAGFRCAALLMRVGNLLIELGALPQDAAMPLTNPASVALAQLLDLPAPGTETGWITGHR